MEHYWTLKGTTYIGYVSSLPELQSALHRHYQLHLECILHSEKRIESDYDLIESRPALYGALPACPTVPPPPSPPLLLFVRKAGTP